MRERRCQASYNVEVVCGGVLPHSGQGRMGHLSLSVKDVLWGVSQRLPRGIPLPSQVLILGLARGRTPLTHCIGNWEDNPVSLVPVCGI